ncbi:MAG: nucleoside monophosphate kinase [Candidatus Nanoarchaeia archaeon]|nr:nucleoside monophosphate kinase [Candidatus Nanoarchaeia archaeon]
MNLILFGPPMTGKGTQAEFISEYLHINHLSTGNMFRGLAEENDKEGLMAKGYWGKGDLVPDSLTIKLLKKEINKEKYKKGFVLDGFPRTLNQAKELKKIARIDKVINIVSGDDTIIKRTVLRRLCSNCQKIYGTNLQPKKQGICDKCGGKLIQRQDDTEEIIKNRLKIYREQTEPVINFYKKEGLLSNINGEQLPEKVFKDIKKAINDGKNN